MSETAASAPSPRIGQGIALVVAFGALLAFFLLQGAPRDASLKVLVHPSGVKVVLLEPSLQDGTAERHAARGILVYEGLPRGAMARVVGRAKGFKDAVASAQLSETGGEVSVKLHLERETARLTVTVDPPDAQIFVDSQAYSQGIALVSDIHVGRHVVSARRTGFAPAFIEVEVKEGEDRQVQLKLEKLPDAVAVDGGALDKPDEDDPPPPGYGRVVVHSTHNSSFFVDNQVAGMGLSVRRNVLAGPHIIGCRAEGRGSDTRRVEVVEGETLVVEFEFLEDPLEKAKAAMDPSTALHWVAKGGGSRNQGAYGEAVDQFKAALEIDPKYWPAHRQLGYTLPALGKWDEAISHFDEYLELNPNAPDMERVKELIGIMEKYQAAEESGEAIPAIKFEGVGFREGQEGFQWQPPEEAAGRGGD